MACGALGSSRLVAVRVDSLLVPLWWSAAPLMAWPLIRRVTAQAKVHGSRIGDGERWICS
jgi:ascorbate-specific PTS system EIIC-type component UlaA